MKTATYLLLALSSFSALLADSSFVKNGGFEREVTEQNIPGWFVPNPAVASGWVARLSDHEPREGKRCAILEHTGKSEPQTFGNLMQSWGVEALRGKRIKLSAHVRHRGPAGSRTQLWLRVDLPEQKMGFFDNSADKPATVDTWSRFEIVGDVAKDAVSLTLGLMTFGKGASSRLDDVQLEILGETPPVEAPRAFTERGLANVIAFIRLVGYVRYFHPSDQAAAFTPAQWDQLTVEGLPKIESSADAADLTARLTKIFQPIAPTVSIGVGKSAPALALPRGSHLHTWQHRGYSLGDEGKRSPYGNTRVRSAKPSATNRPPPA
jgi:hypothetical protein